MTNWDSNQDFKDITLLCQGSFSTLRSMVFRCSIISDHLKRDLAFIDNTFLKNLSKLFKKTGWKISPSLLKDVLKCGEIFSKKMFSWKIYAFFSLKSGDLLQNIPL